MTLIEVPTIFTEQQVLDLWQYQFGPWGDVFDSEADLPLRMHPYTCPNRHDHPMMAGDNGVLVPTVRGWICPFCDYKQGWAHPTDTPPPRKTCD